MVLFSPVLLCFFVILLCSPHLNSNSYMEQEDFEKLLTYPRRIRHESTVSDVNSCLDYITDVSTCYCNMVGLYKK
jgi:hypothetical protein